MCDGLVHIHTFLIGSQAFIIGITGLFKFRNAFMDINIEPASMLDCFQVILVYDILWDDCQFYPHVLAVVHWDSIIEIFDIKCAKISTW